MAGIPSAITNAVGLIGGIIAIVTSIVSLIYLRRQTLHMEAQVDRQIEVKITRDLDAPEGVIDNKLRTFLSKRLNDFRYQMRQEFGAGLQELGVRVDELNRILVDSHVMERKDIAGTALELLAEHKDAIEGMQASSTKLTTLEHEMQALQQTIEDIRNGVGNQAMVRTQIRGIAEQLLRMTSQE